MVKVNGASRTDSGVHSLGQVANFHIESPVPTENFVRAMNDLLPNDIAIKEAVEVPESFDAISDTLTKVYDYRIYTRPIRDPFHIRYVWHHSEELDVDKMNTAADYLIGTHDFKSFASAADQRQSSMRTIISSTVFQKDNQSIIYRVQGDGFLYNMVRNIVGTLVEIGRGRWQPEYIKDILDVKDRTAAGPLAPACGLCLMKINYREPNI